MKRTFSGLFVVAGATALLSWPPSAPAAAPVPVEQARRWPAEEPPLPKGAVLRLGSGRFRHGSLVWGVAFSADGKLLASAANDCTVRLWEVSTGKQLRVFTGFRTGVGAVAFSPDGRTLAATEWSSRAKGIHLLDVAGGPERTIEAGRFGGADGGCVAFSPDGNLLASVSSYIVNLWDATTGRHVATLEPKASANVNRLAFSADGKFLAWTDQAANVCLFDVASRKQLHALHSEDTWVYALAFSADGRRLFTGGLTHEKPGDLDSPIRRCGVRIWDTATGKQLHVLEAPQLRDGVASLAVSPDGRSLVVGSRSGTSWWDLKARELVRLLPGCRNRYQAATGLCFSPDGKLLAGGVGDAVCLWDAASGRLLTPGPEELASGAGSLALSADGRLLAGADGYGTVLLWDFPRRRPRHRLFTHAWEGSYLALSPDGKTIAATAAESQVLVWDTATGRQRQALSAGGGKDVRLRGLAFAPDGRALASAYYSAGQDGGPCGVHLWDVAGKLRQDLRAEDKGHASFNALAFSADGRRLTGSTDFGQTYRWQAAGGRFTAAEALLSGPGVGRVAYSPSGWLAETQPAHLGIGLWNLRTKRPGPQLSGPDGIARGLAFSADGRYLASAAGLLLGGGPGETHDNTLRVYELASGQEVLRWELPPYTGVYSLAFTPDGRKLLTGMSDSTILVWDVFPAAAGKPRPLPALWDDLKNADARRAHQALADLAARGDAAVTFLADRLRPTPATEAAQLAKFLADLDADDFAARERASRELAKLGASAAPALERAEAAARSPEVRRRLALLLEGCPAPVLPPAERRGVRAVTALEHVGTPAAQALLRRLSEGAPEAPLTAEAKAALRRLAPSR